MNIPGVPNPLADIASQLLDANDLQAPALPKPGSWPAYFIDASVKDTKWGKRFVFNVQIQDTHKEVEFSLPLPALTFKVNEILKGLGIMRLSQLAQLPTFADFYKEISKARMKPGKYVVTLAKNKEGKEYAVQTFVADPTMQDDTPF